MFNWIEIVVKYFIKSILLFSQYNLWKVIVTTFLFITYNMTFNVNKKPKIIILYTSRNNASDNELLK